MIFDYFDLIKDVFAEFKDILDFFGDIRNLLSSILSQIATFDFLSFVQPHLSTIRYVAGDTVYLTLARALQISIFILLAKSLYQLLHIILESFNIQKPLMIIKKYLKL